MRTRNNTATYTATPKATLPRGVGVNQTIQVMVQGNPKRPGTKAHYMWQVMQRCNGLTVGQAAQVFAKAKGKVPQGYSLASELRHALKKGYVQLQ